VNRKENEEINYRREIAQAERTGNQDAIQALRAIGPPPYSARSSIKILREWADRLADGDGDPVQARPPLIAPDFTPDEIRAMQQGTEFSRTELYEDINTIDLPALGVSFDIPIFFFHGTCDQQTPIELAEQYFASVVAPHKEFVRFEGCHHFVVMNRPELFLGELLARVRPLL
jgi:pimeloyl-ACP methyl ester carboxylesterase